MKNKIKIVTFHRAHNYGAMLQVFALQEFLKIENYDVRVLDYRNKNIEKYYKPIKFYGKNPINLIKQLINVIIYYRYNKKRYDRFQEFLRNKLILSKSYYKIDNISNIANIYITGSDQVWNPNIVGEISDVYTLNFGEDDVKRISYAASIGNSIIEDKYIEDYKEKLKKIDHMSVREEDGKNALFNILNRKIDVVLDPTLLHNRDFWNNEIKYCKKEEKYILAYVVEENDEYRKIVNYLSEKTGLKVIHFEKNDDYNNVLRSAYTDGPLEFVNLIKNAEYVVATSFHATVFSILFHKKFFIIPHKKTGSRVINLLDKLQIKDRVYFSCEQFKNINYDIETQWDFVEENLKKEREKSIKWLKNAIEN